MGASSTPARILAPRRDRYNQAHRDDHQPEQGKVEPRHLYDAAQVVGCARLPGIAGPQHEAEVSDDEGPAQRQQHLRQGIAGKTAKEQALDQPADQCQGRGARQRRHPEIVATRQ
jgi:hypothetical protein